MFESKLFNQWLEEIKEKRIKDLLEVKEMVNTFKLARKEQATYEVCGYDPIERVQNESDEQYKNWIINKALLKRNQVVLVLQSHAQGVGKSTVANLFRTMFEDESYVFSSNKCDWLYNRLIQL